MHPEIVQNEPGNCPICGMDLVPKPSKDNDHEDETYKLLRTKFWTALAFSIPVFILSMGRMFIDWPFSHQVQGF
jgi:Cu2+-exporting ATPase